MALHPGRVPAALYLSLLALLAPLPSSSCPARCDCSDPRHLVCANRGLRAVPALARAHAPEEEEDAEQQRQHRQEVVLIFSLGGNFISNISSWDFNGFSSLLRLNLQYNRIQDIQPGAFQPLAQLEELYLGHNLLSALPTAPTLRPLSRLRVLDANNNLLSRIGPGTFSQGQQGLLRLRLDRNSIQALQDQDLRGLSGLHHLHLDHNRLRHIHRRSFSGLVRLRLLSLEHNQLKVLRCPLTFSPLGALSSLLLSHNLLQQVSSGVFLRLGSLSTLALGNNRISRLEVGALMGLSRLRQLLLDANRLQEVPAGLLDPLVRLEELDLSRNRISRVAPQAFARLARLKVLRLQENLLASLSGEVFTLNLQLHLLELRGNNWTCDCRLGGLKAWMSAAHQQGVLLRSSSLLCGHPEDLRGKHLEQVESLQLLPLQEQPQLCRSGGGPEGSWEGGAVELGVRVEEEEEREELEQSLQESDHQDWNVEEEDHGQGLQERSQEEVEEEEETRWGETQKREGEEERWKDEVREEKEGVQRDEGGGEISAATKPQKKKKQKESARPRPSPAGEAVPTGRSRGGQRSKVATKAGNSTTSPSPLLLLLRGAPPPPVVTDPCDFNHRFIANVTVGHVTSTAATVHWTCREHRLFTPAPEPGPESPGSGPDEEDFHFRILFDRLGAGAERFPRYVYAAGAARSLTLRELLPGAAYLVCVEGVVRRSLCQVAPRDHCAGLLTSPAHQEVVTAAAGTSLTFDLQLATLATLLLLALLVGGAWLGRSLRRRLQQWRWRRRRKRGTGGGGGPAVHVYATSRPLRHAAEFSYRAPPQPQQQQQQQQQLGEEQQEGDLIHFPCERFLEGGAGGGAYRDRSMTRFSD